MGSLRSRTGQRRQRAWLWLAPLTLVLAAPLLLLFIQPSAQAQVRSLVERQFELFNERNWSELYWTYTSRVRAECPFENFRTAASESFEGAHLTVSDIAVRVMGDQADVTYTATYRSSDGAASTFAPTSDDPDHYVRVGGRWLDDLDAYSSLVCWEGA